MMLAGLAGSIMALTGCGTLLGDDQRDAVSGTAVMRLAETTRAAGDTRGAISMYRRAHQINPNDPAPLVGLGDALLGEGQAELAAAAYRKALDLEADNAAALRGLGTALISLDRPSEAVAALDRLLKKDPGNVPALVAKGVAEDLAGSHREAQAAYLAALEIAPGHTSARNNLALSLALSGQYEASSRMFERLIGEGKAPPARRNLALVRTLETENARLLAENPDAGADARARNLAALSALRGRSPESAAR